MNESTNESVKVVGLDGKQAIIHTPAVITAPAKDAEAAKEAGKEVAPGHAS